MARRGEGDGGEEEEEGQTSAFAGSPRRWRTESTGRREEMDRESERDSDAARRMRERKRGAAYRCLSEADEAETRRRNVASTLDEDGQRNQLRRWSRANRESTIDSTGSFKPRVFEFRSLYARMRECCQARTPPRRNLESGSTLARECHQRVTLIRNIRDILLPGGFPR